MFLEQYNRHYCYSCGRYAPDGYGDRGAKACPTCGGILSYVVAYERYYCYRDNAYLPEEVPAEKQEPVPEVQPQPQPVTPAPEPAVAAPAANPEPAPSTEAPPAEAASPSPEPTPAASRSSTTVVVLAPPRRSKRPVDVVETRTAFTPRIQAPAPEEIRGEGPSSLPKPPLIREVIEQAKKPTLLDLSKAYDLDPTGTKEELRERLLSYLDELEAESSPAEETPTADEPVQTEPLDAFEDETRSAAASPITTETAPEELTREEAPTSVEASSAPQVVQEPRREPAVTRPEIAAAVAPAVQATPRVEQPCPNCGRELSYIAQYNRWYCYSCRAYAPVARSKNACPNCGATLRWIDQYERWWCDSCRRYAPAYLPRPERGVVATQTAALPGQKSVEAAAVPSIAVHRHRSPGSGIGLMMMGLVLFVLYELLVDLPTALAFSTGIALTPDVEWGMRFFGFVFIAIGAMIGLFSVRDRR